MALLLAIAGAALFASAATANAAGPQLQVSAINLPSFTAPGGTTRIEVMVRNVGDQATTSPITVDVRLPPELKVDSVTDQLEELTTLAMWECSSVDPQDLTCQGPDSGNAFELGAIPAHEEACKPIGFTCRIVINATVDPAASADALIKTKACGGGAASCAFSEDLTEFGPPLFAITDWNGDLAPSDDGTFQAGGHPADIVTTFDLSQREIVEGTRRSFWPEGAPRNVTVEVPAGFIGTPTAAPNCEVSRLSPGVVHPPKCPVNSIVGTIEVRTGRESHYSPIFNMEPSPTEPAEFGFNILGFPQLLATSVRSDGDYGVTILAHNISQGLIVSGATATFWGVPADPSHDFQRCNNYSFGNSDHCTGAPGDPDNGPNGASIGAPRPFLTNPTSCADPQGLAFGLRAESWQRPPASDEATFLTGTRDGVGVFDQHGTSGCGRVPFDPGMTVQPTTDRAESPTGLEVNLTIPPDGLNNPAGISQSNLKDAVVKLPEGMTINPSYADGVTYCSPAEVGLTSADAPEIHFDKAPARCPDASQIGEVSIETPLLSEPLTGAVYVAQQDDPTLAGAENPFDGLLALYLVAEGSGVTVKLAGEVDPDPQTGQVITRFLDNPQIPFSRFSLKFKGGQRAPLATPAACGSYEAVGDFTPWARPTDPVRVSDSFQVSHGPDGGACLAADAGGRRFAPGLQAGSISDNAGSYSPFVLRMTRSDGEQEITSFSADLPPGLSGKLAGLAQCGDSAIDVARSKSGASELAAPSCPLASQVGTTLVGSGTGSILTYIPGNVYLAGPYHGSPLSVVAITAAKAGPFDLGTVVVRSALKIDPDDAQVHVDAAGSDPIPHIRDGIALHVRDIRVKMDRPDFTLNPTNCKPTAVTARLAGTGADFADPGDDVLFTAADPFQVANCASLGFKPRQTIRLKGGTRRADHPALIATLTARAGDANIRRAVVTLPRNEFLDNAHIGTICTRVQYAAKACPAGSIYGYAKAVSPILDQPLEGPVYLRSSNNTLPDLVASLDGEIHIDLSGRIDSVNRGIRTTFESIPDAPVSKFTLSMVGGKKGLLQNSANICRDKERADILFVGQNDKTAHLRPRPITDCGKRKKR